MTLLEQARQTTLDTCAKWHWADVDRYDHLKAEHARLEPDDPNAERLAEEMRQLRGQIGHVYVDERDRRSMAWDVREQLHGLAEYLEDEEDEEAANREIDRLTDVLKDICRQGWQFPPPRGWAMCQGCRQCMREGKLCYWRTFNEPFELWKRRMTPAEIERFQEPLLSTCL